MQVQTSTDKYIYAQQFRCSSSADVTRGPRRLCSPVAPGDGTDMLDLTRAIESGLDKRMLSLSLRALCALVP